MDNAPFEGSEVKTQDHPDDEHDENSQDLRNSNSKSQNTFNLHKQNHVRSSSEHPAEYNLEYKQKLKLLATETRKVGSCSVLHSSTNISRTCSHISPVFVKKSHDIKSSSFASLNEEKKYNLLNCGSSSLPIVNTHKTENMQTSEPARDNFKVEQESFERSYDFSRRYSETRPPKNTCKNENIYQLTEPKNDSENFTIYAETDLDQPTNYSLRYAEDDSDTDSESCDNAVKIPPEYVGDTIKTYCTEGTPYETPLNFSTSTSMSDLRCDKNGNEDNKSTEKHKPEEIVKINKLQSSCENNIEAESQQPSTSKIKSEYSSGLISPEKPMNYCEEGTPGYFSRVSSLGSLNSNLVCTGDEKAMQEEKCKLDKDSSEYNKSLLKENQNETKMVKFENNVNYCEETPLMFSRSSSLGSIDSMEQHSIHDDRSSIVSDFSRLTSGLISPSEIPDSPTQTIPSSPKSQKSNKSLNVNKKSFSNDYKVRKSLPKSSIFEDNVTKFKEESTPIQNSITTSLSSLTIDDQDEEHHILDKLNVVDRHKRNFGAAKKNINTNENSLVFDGAGSDRSPCFVAHRPFQTSTSSKLATTSGISFVKNNVKVSCSSGVLSSSLLDDNAPHTYCTEDTPAVLSHNGSISDLSLSTLSALDEENSASKDFECDKGSTLSETGEKEQLVQSEIHMENVWHKRSPVKQLNNCLNMPKYFTANDEMFTYFVEDSPVQFSLSSSLSNLTFESNVTSEAKALPISFKPDDIEENEENNENNSEDYQKTFDEIDTIVEAVDGISLKVVEEAANCSETPKIVSVTKKESFTPKEENCAFNDSLRRKKWKWLWKFASEKSDEVEKEIVPIKQSADKHEKSGSSRSCRLDDFSKNLDNHKKKKWWKWKFLSKEDDHSEKMSDNENGQISEIRNEEYSDLEQRAVSLDRNDTLKVNKATRQDSRNKSKKWKWRWKFSSKEENQTNDVTPLKNIVKEETFKPSSKKLTRSFSEPRSYRKRFDDSSVRHSIKLPAFLDNELAKNQRQLEKMNISECSKENVSNGNQNKIESIKKHSQLEIPEHNEMAEQTNNYVSERDGLATKLFMKPLSPFEEKTNNTVAMQKAILEECIQLGLSKNKNVPIDESRRISTHSTSVIHRTEMETIKHPAAGSSKENESSIKLQESCNKVERDFQLKLEDKQIYPVNFEDEVNLVKKLMMGRVKTKDEKIKNLTSSEINNGATLKEIDQSHESNDNIIDSLDPVTLSIIRKIIDHRFSEGRRNVGEILKDIKLEDTEVYANLNVDDCNFEIVVEGRIKVTLAKKDGDSRTSEPRETLRISSSTGVDNDTNNTSRLILSHGNDVNKIDDSPQPQQISSPSGEHEVIKGTTIYQTNSSNRRENVQNKLEEDVCSSPVKNVDYASLIEECIQMGMPKKKEMEEAIYANIFTLPGYSRSNSLPLRRKPPLKAATPNVETSSKLQNVQNKTGSIGRTRNNEVKIVDHEEMSKKIQLNEKYSAASSLKLNNASLLEECIQLEMPNKEGKPLRESVLNPTSSKISKAHPRMNCPTKKFEEPEMIYANIPVAPGYSRTTNLLSEFSSQCSNPLLGNNRFESLRCIKSNQSKEKADYSSLIEECIQLGMPIKNRSENLESSNSKKDSDKKLEYEALVEECIQLGMPKKKESSEEAIYANTTERYSTFKPMKSFLPIKMTRSDSEPGCSRIPFANYGSNKIASGSVASAASMDKAIEECIKLGWPKRKENLPINRIAEPKTYSEPVIPKTKPKNVNVASVVRSIPEFQRDPFNILATATDAEDVSKIQHKVITTREPDTKTENPKNGYKNNTSSVVNFEENISELSFANWGDIERLDPTITLTHLDRYTAQLIAQAEQRASDGSFDRSYH